MTSAKDVINWMAKQVGIQETPLGSNNVIFNTNYYGRTVSGSAYAWCQAMIWDCFRQLGASSLFGTKSAYTVFVASAFNQQGRFYKSNPQPGDMVFFDWQGGKTIAGIDHVGIVESVNGDGSIVTIEGNVDDRVRRIHRQLTYVVGFARPAYGASSESSSESSSGDAATYTVKAGDSLWKIGQLNSMTVAEIKALNNLDGDTIFIGQKLQLKSSEANAGFAVGQAVTVQNHATNWQNGAAIPAWVRGKSYKIKQIKSVNQSNSKQAYLLEGINSWILQQDIK